MFKELLVLIRNMRAHAAVAVAERRWIRAVAKKDKARTEALDAKRRYEEAQAALPLILSGQGISVPSVSAENESGFNT